MINAATFAEQLAETIAWCKPRVDITDPKWCLRSTALKPDYEYDSADDPTLWNEVNIIQSVVQRRQHAMAGIEPTTLPTTGLHGGRLLLCYFDETNHNYGSAEESEWFYDGYDNPPWDTWVAWLDNALISWVPPQFMDLASGGMAVECCQMLMWLEQPFSYVLDDKPRQIPSWLMQHSWTTPHEDAR
jgi:hypothetical protein